MLVPRTEIVPPSERRTDNPSDTNGTSSILREAREFAARTAHAMLVRLTEHPSNEHLRPLPFLPPGDPALPVSTERRELAEEVEVAALEHPSFLICNGSHPCKTVRNHRTNPPSRPFRDRIHDLPPLLLRLVPGSEDRSQEDEILSINRAESEQVRRPLRSINRVPERIEDEDELAAWWTAWPRTTYEELERGGMSLLPCSGSYVGSERACGECLLVREGAPDDRGAVLARFWTAFLRSHRPRRTAVHALPTTGVVDMNAVVFAVRVRGVVWHTPRTLAAND
ncbi:MAG: hypothetical protein WC659_07275 [Patescibacteria group bacterium]